MNVLVLAPHPDDEAIGCGGTLCLHAERGDKLTVVFLTSGELGLKELAREEARAIREKEARSAANVMGISNLHFLRGTDSGQGEEISRAAQLLAPIIEETQPELVYLPHPLEWHPDHKAALPIFKTAFKKAEIKRPKARAYEIWTPLSEYSDVENISSVINRKLEAIRAHRSQVEHWAYDRAIQGLNQYRGVMAGRCEYAEVFQILNA